MKNLFTIFLLSTTILVHAQRVSFDEDWKFSLGDTPGAEMPEFDDSGWRILDVPHDWSIEGEYSEAHPMGDRCGYLPAGIGWYRKTVKVPEEWKGKYVEIVFDGVFMNSTVWANGRKLGHRPYGWISFAYDILPEIIDDEYITFAVRVDNEKQPSARWYTGSGIYGHTWIDVKGKVHIPASGITITTDAAKVSIRTEVTSVHMKKQKGSLVTRILDPYGQEVHSYEQKISIDFADTLLFQEECELQDPMLWSPEKANLYTAVSTIQIRGKVSDELETRFGIRDIEWIPETGMWLNGKNVKLRGVCNHQDGGAFGAAVPEKIMRFRVRQLKAMGCNAIRTAHNPFRPEFYDICDEEGMIVMDELYDGWHKKAENDYGAHSFDEWWRRDLRDWIRRDRNHPSIVIYSVGNETRGEVAKDLVEACHAIDPTRPVTSGHSGSEYMDVYGVNGGSENVDFFETLEKDRVFIGTENTHTFQVRGYYRTLTWYRDGYENPKRRPYWYPDLTDKEVFSYDWTDAPNKKNFKQVFNSSYDNAIVRLNSRQNIEMLRDLPFFAGSFRWTGYDYIGEAGYVHGGWPFKAFMGGAIDLANFEKDLYYLYQSQWTKEPMIHMLPHWTHPTLEEGVEIPVWVYSNCDEVELIFNGRSLGKKKPGKKWDKMQCQWMVPWKPGTLKAVGYTGGTETVQTEISTADAPAQISLAVDGEALTNKEKDITQVRVTALDSKGEFYPYGENRSLFHVLGPGKIRALDNGSPIDVERHFEASDRIAFYGLTRAYVESTAETGDITLLVGAILGEKTLITSSKVNIDVELIALRGIPVEPEIEVYYTTDGSVPDRRSKKYSTAFDVVPGTTVKALVVVDGKPLKVLTERFADNEGFVFETVAVAAVLGGDQAEDASYNIAVFDDQGSGYNGKGFLDFGRNAGAWVEWYQENDGSDGEFSIQLRYSASSVFRDSYKLLVIVNEEEQEITVPASKNYRKDWDVVEVSAKLLSGANYIRVTALDDNGLCIDEMKLK